MGLSYQGILLSSQKLAFLSESRSQSSINGGEPTAHVPLQAVYIAERSEKSAFTVSTASLRLPSAAYTMDKYSKMVRLSKDFIHVFLILI